MGVNRPFLAANRTRTGSEELSRNWWRNRLNANELYKKQFCPPSRLVAEHQFLAQVTGPQVFVNAS
jgi:hypothetical protein